MRIMVTLTDEEDREAHRMARARRAEASQGGYRRAVQGTHAEDLLGARGELAVARYLGIRHPGWHGDVSWEADISRGSDVGGYQVRSAASESHGLALDAPPRARNTGRFILVLGHQAPVMCLAGWIEAEEGYARAVLRHDGVGQPDWYRVGQRHLHPLTAREQPSQDRSIEGRVRDYILTCTSIGWLRGKYHPTAAGALKLIYHHGDPDEAAEIKAAFEKLSPPPGKKLRRTAR